MITPMSVQNSIFIDDVFQIEVSEGLSKCPRTPRESTNCKLAFNEGVYGSRAFFFCKCLEFKRITPMRVRNSIFIGTVFQTGVSAGLVHPLGVDNM